MKFLNYDTNKEIVINEFRNDSTGAIIALTSKMKLSWDERFEFFSEVLGRNIQNFDDMTNEEKNQVITILANNL